MRVLQAKGPLNASLSDHFFAKFRRGSQECKAAQRAFAESMAAYSLVCYFLQIKVSMPLHPPTHMTDAVAESWSVQFLVCNFLQMALPYVPFVVRLTPSELPQCPRLHCVPRNAMIG